MSIKKELKIWDDRKQRAEDIGKGLDNPVYDATRLRLLAMIKYRRDRISMRIGDKK